MTKQKIYTILLLFIVSSLSYSQSFVKDGIYADGRLEVGATGQFTKYFGEFTDNNVGYGGGFITKYFIPSLPEISVGAKASYGYLVYDRRYKNRLGTDFYRQFPKEYFIDADKISYERETDITTVDFFINFNLFPRSQINYYLFVGYSVLSFQNEDIENSPLDPGGDRIHYRDFKDQDEFDFHLVGGMGIDFFLTRNVSLGAWASYRLLNTDMLDGYAQIPPNGSTTNNDGIAESGLKLSYYLFNDNDHDSDGLTNEQEAALGTNPYKSDTDGDGIADNLEINLYNSDPKLADSDGDGMTDGEEIANSSNPNKSDSDGDGISDYEELMLYNSNPNEIDSDKDGLTDIEEVQKGSNPMNGDTDGDGIPDLRDKCPSVFGIKLLDGCPQTEALVKEIQVRDTITIQSLPDTVIIVQEIERIKKGDTYKPKGIHFVTGSAEIRVESELILDDIAEWLKKNERISVEVQGHTDRVGSDAANMKLSKERAESVMFYLIKNGVSPTRLKAKGFGESMPLDTSGTEKGTAKNRRIEFKIIEN
ncbi:MAG: OmpA family protein [Chlorobiota bacterium]